ncbi:MAG TPA: amino acid ABC transporter substrate-binding protein [Firmicutes bacterium]|nr:amino acid ABC transporter substrate-binding protein [Bacillota bacterium]
MIGCAPQAAPAADTPAAPVAPVKGDPIVIAVPTALGSIEGRDGFRAIMMAAEEINDAGGVSVGGEQRPFEVVSIDTREHEPGIPVHDALAALERIILTEEPHAILFGAFRSEVLLASMDIIAEHRIPYIATTAMTPEMERKIAENYDKYKYIFRMCLNAPYFVQYLSQLMGHLGEQFGFNKAYILAQDVLWARGTGAGLEKFFKENGWEVVGFDTYPTGAADFSSSLTKAKIGGAQVVVPIFDMPQSGILVKQARDMEVPALVAGFISPAAPENAWEVFDGELDGLINFIFEIGPLPVEAVPESMEFNRRFGEKFGEDARLSLAGHAPGPSYDSVYVLKEAIERAGSLDADAIVEELKKTDHNGVIGRIRFNENHQVIYGLDPAEAALGAAFQWRAPGVRVPIFPELIAEDTIQLPPYM